MKKRLSVFLVICICIGMCACGGVGKKSIEAQKADELILAIGDVTLESEPSILAAQAFFDTLTDKQKGEVENVAILEVAASELVAIKAASEYKRIYESAIKYETEMRFEEAYAEYEKLPSDYEDVAQRMSNIAPLSILNGTWTCDSMTAKSNKGTMIGALYKEIKVEIGDYSDGFISFNGYGTWADSKYTNTSIVAGHMDLLALMDSFFAYGDLVQQKDGSWSVGSGTCGKSGFGTLKTNYFITADGHLLMECVHTTPSKDVISVEFTYSKK